VGDASVQEGAKFLIEVLRKGFSTFRKGEPQWTAARAIGWFTQTLRDINTISIITAPTREDYLNYFKEYSKDYNGLLIYNCSRGIAKFVSGEATKLFPGNVDICCDRKFPHDFPEQERDRYSGSFEPELEWD
jgi:hypothetical protein